MTNQKSHTVDIHGRGQKQLHLKEDRMMKKKCIICCSSAFLLAVCFIFGTIYFWQGKQIENSVFTDAFFENMLSISPFLNEEVMLEGQAAENVVSYLKGIQLEPTEGTPTSDTQSENLSEVRVGGNQGYCIRYQNGETVHFYAFEATLTIGSRNYHVVDRDGKPILELGETVWKFFHPDA